MIHILSQNYTDNNEKLTHCGENVLFHSCVPENDSHLADCEECFTGMERRNFHQLYADKYSEKYSVDRMATKFDHEEVDLMHCDHDEEIDGDWHGIPIDHSKYIKSDSSKVPEVYNVERIEWKDSFVIGGWRSVEEYASLTPSPMVSFGVVVRDDEECVTITQSYTQRGPEVSDAIVIPQGCIVSRTVIGSVKKESDAFCTKL